MPIPEKVPLYHEMSLLDCVIDEVASQDKPLGAADFNRVAVAAQIQEGIDRYRATAANTSFEALLEEDHCSRRLAAHLHQTKQIRPLRCHAHAIVAGRHKKAWSSKRYKLMIYRLRFDRFIYMTFDISAYEIERTLGDFFLLHEPHLERLLEAS